MYKMLVKIKYAFTKNEFINLTQAKNKRSSVTISSALDKKIN